MDENGNVRMAVTRYTKKQGQALYDTLSPIEQEFVKEFTAIKDEATSFINREMIKDAYKIESDVEGWIHHFWEDSFFGVGKTRFKNKKAAASMQRT